MSHSSRVRHHIVVDILSSVAGGSAVVAIVQKSWVAGLISAVAFIGLFILDRCNIEEEEPVDPIKDEKMKLLDLAIANLRHIASREKQKVVSPEDVAAYTKGLDDGASTLAEYILTELKEE